MAIIYSSSRGKNHLCLFRENFASFLLEEKWLGSTSKVVRFEPYDHSMFIELAFISINAMTELL